MITTAQLNRPCATGRQEQRRLAEVLDASPVASEAYPYVHRDDPLDTALRRMGDSGVDILPVVSRTDLGKVIGVISACRMRSVPTDSAHTQPGRGVAG